MDDDGRVVTAKLPDHLVARLDRVAERIDRSKSWILRTALSEWLDDEERRHELTLEALASVDAGLSLSQEQIEARVEQRQRDRRAK